MGRQYEVSVISVWCQCDISVISGYVSVMSVLCYYYVSVMSVRCPLMFYDHCILWSPVSYSGMLVRCQYEVSVISVWYQVMSVWYQVTSVWCQYYVIIMSVWCQCDVSVMSVWYQCDVSVMSSVCSHGHCTLLPAAPRAPPPLADGSTLLHGLHLTYPLH